jgi:hypothetical protein
MGLDNSALVVKSSRDYTFPVLIPCPMDTFELMGIDPGFQRVLVLLVDRMVDDHRLG